MNEPRETSQGQKSAPARACAWVSGATSITLASGRVLYLYRFADLAAIAALTTGDTNVQHG